MNPLNSKEYDSLSKEDLMLDYKKLHATLELQTRELSIASRKLEIEAALERVRERTMVMHHTSELQDVINTIHQQFESLSIEITGGVFLGITQENKTQICCWGAGGTANYVQRVVLPYYDKPIYTGLLKGINQGPGFFTESFNDDEKFKFFDYLFERPPYNATGPEWKKEVYSRHGGYTRSGSVSEHTTIFMINHHGRVFTEDENAVLRQFGAVFEQTYTRFLDLYKAEEQARKIKHINQENERLLHSILPKQIAIEIRSGRQNVVKRFEEVSILFADIVGFTEISEKLKPGRVVQILNGLFSLFDDLTDKYGLEKIKTIGDAYMVAAGVPEEKPDHAQTIFRFAKEMLISLKKYNQSQQTTLNLRIGIGSGPVVAGVIGKKKFAYDLWGDTVNTAARMEAYGQEGKIQVAPSSYELLKDEYDFEKIPGVEIKGKGVMDVYIWENQEDHNL